MAEGKIYEYTKARNFLTNMLMHMSVSERLPSERELAEMFQVSRVTMRRALTELFQHGYMEKRPRSGYYSTGKALMEDKRIIGVLVFDGITACHDGDSRMLYAALYEESLKYDFSIEPIITANTKSLENDLKVSNLDALVWYSIGKNEVPVFKEYSRLHPGVTVGIENCYTQAPWSGTLEGMDNVFMLDIDGTSRELIRMLLDAGCRKILRIDGDFQLDEIFREAHETMKIPYHPELKIRKDRFREDFPELYKKYHPDGIAVHTMKQLNFLLGFAKENKIRIPEDLQIIYTEGWMAEGVTQYLKPFRAIARETFRYIDDHLNGGQSALDLSVAQWEFIQGKTTKRIRK